MNQLPLFFFFLCFTTTLGQSPAPGPIPQPPAPVSPPPASITLAPPLVTLAPSPGPPGPTNITAILEKAARFTTLIRLLKSTQTDNQLNIQINKSAQGLTFFAPSDHAFSSLKTGTLNSFIDSQKTKLVQFHVLPTFLSISQFETLSNPVNTQAGEGGRFVLNITTTGTSLNMTTGKVNASVVSTVYTDNHLAVYEVDKVLLPLDFYLPPPPNPAPAPAPSKPKKAATPAVPSNIPSGTTNPNTPALGAIISSLMASILASFFI